MKHIFKILALVAAVAVAGVGAHRAKVNSSDQAAEVRAARAAQNAAIAARDMERVASYWTEDITVTTGLGRMLRGRSEYRKGLEGDAAVIYERVPERVEVSAHEKWPLAFEVGTWTGRTAGGGSHHSRGRYAAHWVKAGNQWLIRSELYVSLDCSGSGCERAAQSAVTAP